MKVLCETLDKTERCGDQKKGLHFGNSRNHEHWGFEVFGKVEEGWPIAKSVRNMCPISLEA